MPAEPYIYSERHFRRYEPYIENIVASWPQPAVFNPNTLTVETLASRLRICLTAVKKANFAWPMELDEAKLVQIIDEIYISTTVTPRFVVCGPADVVKALNPSAKHQPNLQELDSAAPPLLTQVASEIRLTSPPNDLILAVLCFHHHQLLTEPSVIQTATNIKQLVVDLGYDVAVEEDTSGVYTIL